MYMACLITAFKALQVYRVPDWCTFISLESYKYFDLDLTDSA